MIECFFFTLHFEQPIQQELQAMLILGSTKRILLVQLKGHLNKLGGEDFCENRVLKMILFNNINGSTLSRRMCHNNVLHMKILRQHRIYLAVFIIQKDFVFHQ